MKIAKLADAVLEFGGRIAGRLGISPFFFESALRRPLPEKRPVLLHFVCQGNILRSAYAAERMRLLLDEYGMKNYSVSSSGTLTDPGKPADPIGMAAASSRGLSLDSHRTSPIDESILESAWLIVTLDRKVHYRVAEAFPGQAHKRLLLASLLLSNGEGPNVRDPYGRPLAIVGETFDLIDRALEKLVKELPASPTPRSRSETDITQPSEG